MVYSKDPHLSINLVQITINHHWDLELKYPVFFIQKEFTVKFFIK